MTNNTYNGWTNYATWRINLEYGFDNDCEYYKGFNGGELEALVEDLLEENCTNQMTLQYALAFISDVNWDEIALNMEEK